MRGPIAIFAATVVVVASVIAGQAGAVTAATVATTGRGSQPRMSAAADPGPRPQSSVMHGTGKVFDVRRLPQTRPRKRERPERPEPFNPNFMPFYGPGQEKAGRARIASPSVPVPPPIANFDGLDFATWGDGHPPDTNGDAGPTYYIQTINTSIGIFDKNTGNRVAAFTFNNFMSQGNFGNLCDTDNFGDPVVLYDTFEDRWIVTDFAFQLDGQGNVINPPGAFQCFAASKTGDPVAGGWNFYSINTAGGLGDYPKFGIWPNGLYMSTNMFDYAAAGSFQNVRTYSFNKAQMYAGSPTVQVVSFDLPSSEFTLLPSNARLQAGTPPAGRPNYYASVWNYTNRVSVWKFQVDWNSPTTSTFTGPSQSTTATSWASPPSTVAEPSGTNTLDTLGIRLMMQNQYTNIGGVESLWDSHTVRGSSTSQAAVRYYQVKVTGGTVEANPTQAATWNPDATNRFMPSAAVDRAGDMAIGYTTSSSSLFPGIKYAGRLATDPVNTISLTETTLVQGTGGQSGTCGNTCHRWGDYSAMTLDPDGCTFWYTNEYYTTTGLNFLTRIGSFRFTQCTPIGSSGTVSGTVTSAATSNPINGATVALGSRTTTTNGSGAYSFTGLPAGTYPSVTASAPGFNPSTSSNVIVTDGATTTKNFSLSTAPASACLTDTSQADFQTALAVNTCDFTTSAGNVILGKPSTVDQSNTTLGSSGFGFNATTWDGQTFTAGVTGSLVRAEINLFCSSCTGTTPNLTLSVRATSGGLPTGGDLASLTIGGFSSGASAYYGGTFSSPPTLTAGTVYALVVRAVSNPSAGTYAMTVSSSNVYAGGARVLSSNSGSTWSAGNPSRDGGFHTYMMSGFATSGDFTSGLKDANPATGSTPTWTTLSWTATTPAGTAVKFQAAGSSSPGGPFSFVGPNGTASTFFTTSGASLAQFNGKRYLEYTAFLTGTGSTSPTLADVTVCFSDVTQTAISIDDVSAAEGNAATTSFDFTVSLSSASSQTVTVAYATADDTATQPSDYTAVGATLTFTPGQTSKTVSVSVNGDTTVEPDETFFVNLSAATNATIADAQGVGTIQNDDVEADLSLGATDAPDPVFTGDDLTYTLTVTDTSATGATGVTLTDTLPSGVAYESATPSQGTCTPSLGTVTCNLGSVAGSGGSATATIVVAPTAGAGTYTNSATVGANEPDPNAGDNSVSISTTMTGPACTMIGTTGVDTLSGTGGNDVICGLEGNDALSGGAGADHLAGGTGDDTMNGGDGNDVLRPYLGNDTVSGDAGNDTVTYVDAPAGVTVDLTVTGAQNTVGAGTDTITTTENAAGSSYDDTLTGDATNNSLYGFNGNDTMDAGGGNDYLEGNAGNDTLTGGDGNDRMAPGTGDDTVTGGNGTADAVTYYDITGTGVTLDLSLTTPQNTVGAGTDTITTTESASGSLLDDTLTGDGGPNTLVGRSGNDIMSGGGGNDYVEGDSGNDTLHGDDGNDSMLPGTGDDPVIDGGAGTDAVSYGDIGTAGVTVDLNTTTAQNTGGGGTDTITNCEGAVGSNGNDTLTGTPTNNNFIGLSGNDTITGGAGNDSLEGDAGDDTLTGGDGNDTMLPGTGDDSADGSNGTDAVSYPEITASSGVTVNLSTTSQQDTVGAGLDTISSVESVAGSNQGDSLTGTTGANTMVGRGGNDTISGLDGNDYLEGDAGTDALDGGADFDTCVSGETNLNCENIQTVVVATTFGRVRI
jgi:Ca2+-binding RTX toxin-like protein